MTTSPQQKIYNLKRALADLGITEDRDWNAGENTYTISGESDALLFSVRLPVPEQELPEELKPHAWSDYEVDRSMSKGNAEKRTISGARFEIALKDYANKVFRERADVAELEAGVADFKSMDDFRAYEARLQEIWNLMYEENTRLRELEQDLEENYY